MARSAGIIKKYGDLNIPATGIYVGAEDADSDRLFTGTKGIETQTGRRMAIRRRHYQWLAAYPGSGESSDVALTNPRVIPMVCQNGDGSGGGGFPVYNTGSGWASTNTNTTSFGKGIDRITNGEFDSFFTARANALKALNVPVLYNLFYEFNGAHTPFYAGAQGTIGSANGTPGTGETRYINAYRHIRGIFDSVGASISTGGKVIFIWCAQGPSTAGFYQNYYPGNAYVDMIGLDLYRATFADRATNPGTYNGGTGSQDYYLFAQSKGKPFIICEAGLKDGATVPDQSSAGGDGNNYDKDGRVTGNSLITKTLADIKSHPDTVAYVHWNELGNATLSGTGNYIDTTAASLNQYKAFFNDAYCQLVYNPSTNSAPQNSAPPTLSDTTPTQGQVLSVNPGTWSGTPTPTLTYQWQRDGANLSGQTGTTYTVVAGDVGHTLDVVETANNGVGSPVSVASSASQPVVGTGIQQLSTSPIASTPDFYSSTWVAPPDTHKNDGRVEGVGIEVNGVVYVGSDSDHTIDGSSGTDRTSTPYLMAYRKDTGATITTWAPAPDSTVYALYPFASNTKLLVVGNFANIAGVARPGVAVLNLLTGVTDTTAATSQQASLSVTGGDVRCLLVDLANNRAWIGGNFTSAGGSTHNGLARLTLSAGVWSVSAGFTASVTGGDVKGLALKPDGTKLVYGGNCSPSMGAVNPDTGAGLTWNHTPSNTPGIFDLAGDANCVYVAGGNDSADILVAFDWNGSGTNSLTSNTGTFNAYWYYRTDGNVQAVALVTIAGTTYVMAGHHGDFVSTAKNSTANLTVIRHGLFTVTAGTTGGTLYNYGDPPDFSSPNVGGVVTGSPLKVFAIAQDTASGSLHIGGDFTAVNGSGGNSFRRYARFDATGGTGVPVNTAIPSIDDTLPVIGDLLTGSDGSWTNTPTSYVRQWQRVDSSGAVTNIAGATSTTYTVVTADLGFKIQYTVKAVNASGTSAPSTSAPTAATTSSNQGIPPVPVIDQGSEPTNPTQLLTAQFTWTDSGTPDHYRYRLTTNGVAGAWTVTTTPQSVVYTTAVGNSYVFEVQAGNVSNQYSTSAQWGWTVTSGAGVATPVITFGPSGSSDTDVPAFTWTESGADSGYRYNVRLDTPAGQGTWSNDINSGTLVGGAYSYPNNLTPGSYTFNVRAKNAAGQVSTVASRAFTVTANAPTPNLVTYPSNPTANASPGFTWSA